MKGPVDGILPVIPTPLLENRFDRESFGRLLDHMLGGVDGYTLLGSTGEAPSMTTAERMSIAEEALAMTPDSKRVVVGVTSTCVEDAVALARHAEEHGAAAVLCAAPFYFANSPSGVLEFLREIDAAIGIDLVFYDNPAATKTPIAAGDPIAWAAELEHLRTVKLTDHEMGKVEIWQEAGLAVMGGDDPIFFEYLDAGVDGVMMIAPAIFPAAFREVWTQIAAGRTAAAFDVFAREVLPFVHVFGIGREIATSKALLADIGVFTSAEVRAPLEPVTDERRRVLRQAYDLGMAATGRRLHEGGAGPV
jgi:4-hydroxy-tetrahydrodipicolinate synthase